MPIHLERIVEREVTRRTLLLCIDVWWNNLIALPRNVLRRSRAYLRYNARLSIDVWWNLVVLRRNVLRRSRAYLRYNARLVQLALWCWMWEFDSVRKGRLRSA